jgi:hypothetical protein
VISPKESTAYVKEIERKGWWQGSVVTGADLSIYYPSAPLAEYWIMASQTCNLYNKDFERIPVVEIVAAKKIDACKPGFVKGDNPRILHAEASSTVETLSLEIDIQKRLWIPRHLLVNLPMPVFRLRDKPLEGKVEQKSRKWNDNFAGWLARSYTRVALPDEFNRAIKVARIEDAIEKKLLKQPDDIYGIYFSINSDSDEDWFGALGEMPPPYLLEIMVVVEENVDPEVIRASFIAHLFNAKVQDPEDATKKISRADLARKNSIRIIRESVFVKNIREISLYEMKSLVRFSMVDHLSDSAMAVEK